MQNLEKWTPSKYVLGKAGDWRASSDVASVSVGSRINVDCLAELYGVLIPKYVSGDVCDLGCGRVPLYGIYRSSASSVWCVDWSNSTHDALHVDTVADLNFPSPLSTEVFDTVVSSDVLEHIWDSGTYLNEAVRVLRPGGILLLGTPFLYPLHEEPYDYFRWTKHSLERACMDRGLEVLELKRVGGAIEVILDLVAKLLAHAPLSAGIPLVELFRRVRRARMMEKLSSRTGKATTLGFVLVARKRQS